MSETFDGEDIEKAEALFRVLATNPDHMATRDRYGELYSAYITNSTIRELADRQADIWQCTIVTVQGNPNGTGAVNRDGLCLVPDALDTVLGFTPATLRDRIFRGSRNTTADYHLQMFIIMTIIVMFYDGSSTKARTRNTLTTMLLQSEVERQLQVAAEREKTDEGRAGILYADIAARFEGLGSDPEGTTKSTKQGVIHNILTFLQTQGLVDYAQADKRFSPTAKMDAIMEQVVLTDRYYQEFAPYFSRTAAQSNETPMTTQKGTQETTDAQD